MTYQPDPYHQSEAAVQQAHGAASANQQLQPPTGSSTSAQNQGISGTNPYIRYTLLDGIIGFAGALVVLYTQSLAGTFFIFFCAFIALYRGIRALIYANLHPGVSGRATGIASLVLGILSIGIMIYLFVTVGVQ